MKQLLEKYSFEFLTKLFKCFKKKGIEFSTFTKLFTFIENEEVKIEDFENFNDKLTINKFY